MQSTYPAKTVINSIYVVNYGKYIEPLKKTFKNDIIMFLGDSITEGWVSTTYANVTGFSGLLRVRNPSKSFIVDAVGGEDISEFRADRLANVLAAISLYQIETVWINYGANGQVLNFAIDYAYVLDQMISANPNITIYCQTPILTLDFEVLTQQKRDLIAIEANLRTDNCILIDGKTILTTDDLSDGVHPTESGYEIYANFVANELNLV